MCEYKKMWYTRNRAVQKELRYQGETMRDIYNIEIQSGSKEEKLPGYTADFPYIASRGLLDRYPGKTVPWHWHRTVELFYMKSGKLEYYTPNGTYFFQKGDCGFINSNILHKTKALPDTDENIQLLHLFDPYFIAGEQSSRIARKYVLPVISSPGFDVLMIPGEASETKQLAEKIRVSFDLDETETGYEIKLRECLSEIWLDLLTLAAPRIGENQAAAKTDSQIKNMMVYIQEHYAEKINVAMIAEDSYLSERECYRIFQKSIHMSPVEYLTNYRIQAACHMLTEDKENLTVIAQNCGFGSSSYFGKIFKECMGCTPLEYRKKVKWQNSDVK